MPWGRRDAETWGGVEKKSLGLKLHGKLNYSWIDMFLEDVHLNRFSLIHDAAAVYRIRSRSGARGIFPEFFFIRFGNFLEWRNLEK